MDFEERFRRGAAEAGDVSVLFIAELDHAEEGEGERVLVRFADNGLEFRQRGITRIGKGCGIDLDLASWRGETYRLVFDWIDFGILSVARICRCAHSCRAGA